VRRLSLLQSNTATSTVLIPFNGSSFKIFLNFPRYIPPNFLQYLCEGKTFYENKSSPKYVH